MLGFFIQRILQAVLVIIAMSVIVFVGVYAIGNPIDVMIDPASDQALRNTLIQRYGFDRPLIRAVFHLHGQHAARRSREIVYLIGFLSWA